MHKANQVKQWVSEILTTTGAEKLDLICHCFGALHARYYIKYLGGIDYVDDYVSLAGPHHGEPTYDYSCTPGTNELAQYLNEGDASPGGILNDTIGPRKDTIFDDIIYNSTHIPGVISYTSIASRHDEVIPYNSSKLDGAEYILVNDTQHMQMFKDWTVYEYVREAIDDLNINWNGNTAWDFSPIILLTSIIMVVYWKRKKK